MTRLEVTADVFATCVVSAEPAMWLEAAILSGPVLADTAGSFCDVSDDLGSRYPDAAAFVRDMWDDSASSWRSLVECAVAVSDDAALPEGARTVVSALLNSASDAFREELRRLFKTVETDVVAGNRPEFIAGLRQMGRETGRSVANCGLGHLLQRSDLGLQWHDAILTVNDGSDRRARVEAKRIVIQPLASLIHTPDEATVVCHPDRVVVGVPCLAPPAPPSDGALEDLLGVNRAQILRAIEPGITGNGLASATGFTASSVSRHTTVLREAGLLQTSRIEGFAQHTMTPLWESIAPRRSPKQ